MQLHSLFWTEQNWGFCVQIAWQLFNLSIQSRKAGLWKLETILERLSHTIPSVLKHEVGSRTSHKVWKLYDSTKRKVVLRQKGKQQVDLDGTKDVLTLTPLILSWTNVFVYLASVVADQTVMTAFNQCCCLSWIRFRTSSSWADQTHCATSEAFEVCPQPQDLIYNRSGFNHSGVDNHPVACTSNRFCLQFLATRWQQDLAAKMVWTCGRKGCKIWRWWEFDPLLHSIHWKSLTFPFQASELEEGKLVASLLLISLSRCKACITWNMAKIHTLTTTKNVTSMKVATAYHSQVPKERSCTVQKTFQ